MKATLWLALTGLAGILLTGCGDDRRDVGQQITPPATAAEQAPPPDFVPVDKPPEVIKKVEPLYPELAKRAGMEGKVWVKIWIDAEGKVKEASVLKSDADIFNQPALDAAKQFLFKPAFIKEKPVSVWVSVPFKFALADKTVLQRKQAQEAANEASFLNGYIAAKKDALSSLQKEAAAAKKNGARTDDIERKIIKYKIELEALLDAARAMKNSQ